MSTYVVAGLLIAVVVFICLILVSINNKHRQKTTAAFIAEFSKAGTENNLSFSSQEILENCIIGLDGRKRKLLILNKCDNDKYETLLINLDEVKKSSKKKIFRSVNIGTEKKEKFENQLDKIVLELDFIETKQPVHILFFEPFNNHILTMSDLERKAKNWEAILSQIINTGLKRRA